MKRRQTPMAKFKRGGQRLKQDLIYALFVVLGVIVPSHKVRRRKQK